MKQRIITAIVMAIILVPLFILGGWFTNVLFAIFAYIGTYELINIRSKKNNLPKISKYIIPDIRIITEINNVIKIVFFIIFFAILVPAFIYSYFNENSASLSEKPLLLQTRTTISLTAMMR